MSVELELSPKQKRPAGEPCCEPLVYPDIGHAQAERLSRVAKALGDPIRLQLIDVLRKHAGRVCVCELTPLFEVSQPTVSHHLKVLREAGLVDSERRGLWAYYYVPADALAELGAWVGAPDRGSSRDDAHPPVPPDRTVAGPASKDPVAARGGAP
jgi:ArsR family transcriptional regulator